MARSFQDRLREEREAQRRRELLEHVQAERVARARAEQRDRERREAQMAQDREQERLAQQREAARDRRVEELRLQQKRESVRAQRAPGPRLPQQREVPRLQRVEDLRLRQQREAARSQRREELRAAGLRQQQHVRRQQARNAGPRPERQPPQEDRTARLHRQPEPRQPNEAPRKTRREPPEMAVQRRRREEPRVAVRRQPPIRERKEVIRRPRREEPRIDKRRERPTPAAEPRQAPRVVEPPPREPRRPAVQRRPPLRNPRTNTGKPERTRQRPERREPARDLPARTERGPARLAESRAAARMEELLSRRRAAVSPAPTPAPAPEEPLDSLSWLKTRGCFIVNEFGRPVYLRGVTCRGIDAAAPAAEQTFLDVLSLDEPNLSTLTGLWGVNLIRLPFQAQTALSGNSILSADALLQGLDQSVAAISAAGSYVLLALEAPPGDGSVPAPDATTFAAWSLLARHYQSEPAVLYEIFSAKTPLSDDWLTQAAKLVGTIRLENPAALILLGSGKGGADVTGLPLRFATGDPVFNIVYTIDVSPSGLPAPDDPILRALAASYPVCVCPWSVTEGDLGRGSEAASNLFERYGMGWIASNWNAEPRLVTDASAHEFTPTRWGLIAQRALAQPVKPLLPSLRVEDEAAFAWRLD